MAYDLIIKHGRVVDGSGMPAFRGDVAVTNGKIVAIGKLRERRPVPLRPTASWSRLASSIIIATMTRR